MYQKRINSKRLLGKLLYQNPLFKFGITAIFLIISIIQPLSLIITQKKQTGNTYSENRSTNKYEHQFDLFIEEESSEEDENHHELGSVNKLFNKDYFFQVLHFSSIATNRYLSLLTSISGIETPPYFILYHTWKSDLV